MEIKECLRQIDTAKDFPDEIFKQYETLKKEKETLIASQDLFM